MTNLKELAFLSTFPKHRHGSPACTLDTIPEITQCLEKTKQG